jgi:hypothetical protein
LLIENVHPEADYAEMRDLFAQGGSMVQLDLFPFYRIATVSMGLFLFAHFDLWLSWASVANAITFCCRFFQTNRM